MACGLLDQIWFQSLFKENHWVLSQKQKDARVVASFFPFNTTTRQMLSVAFI